MSENGKSIDFYWQWQEIVDDAIISCRQNGW